MNDFERLQTLARRFAQERKSSVLAGRIATEQLIRDGKLTDNEILELAALYPQWQPGMEYKVGDIVQFLGKLYEVVQAHTAQDDWQPDQTPALYELTVSERTNLRKSN